MSYEIKQDGKFKYIEEGDGEPLILLHGLFGALSNFTDLIDHFRKSYQVIVPFAPPVAVSVVDEPSHIVLGLALAELTLSAVIVTDSEDVPAPFPQVLTGVAIIVPLEDAIVTVILLEVEPLVIEAPFGKVHK